jgi:hypothetical protein
MTKTSKLLHLEVHETLGQIPSLEAGEKEWRTYEAKVRGQIRKSQKNYAPAETSKMETEHEKTQER